MSNKCDLNPRSGTDLAGNGLFVVSKTHIAMRFQPADGIVSAKVARHGCQIIRKSIVGRVARVHVLRQSNRPDDTMTENETDDRENDNDREGFFANSGSRMLIGRFLAVGLFVALGTFAVIQSLSGPQDPEPDSGVVSSETEGSQDSTADSQGKLAASGNAIVKTSLESDEKQPENKSKIGGFNAKFNAPKPKSVGFSSPTNNPATSKPISVRGTLPEVRSSSSTSFGSPSVAAKENSLARKPIVATKPPVQDASPPQNRIAALQTDSAKTRFGIGGPAIPPSNAIKPPTTGGQSFQNGINALNQKVTAGAAAAGDRFKSAASDLKQSANSALERTKSAFGAPRPAASNFGNPVKKPDTFGGNRIQPIVAKPTLNALKDKPFGTPRSMPTSTKIGGSSNSTANSKQGGSNSSGFTSQPLKSISQAAPQVTPSRTRPVAPAPRQNNGFGAQNRSLAIPTDRPKQTGNLASNRFQGGSLGPTTPPARKPPTQAAQQFPPAQTRTPASLPVASTSRIAAPAIQASSVSAVPGDRKFDGVQSTGLILQKASPREIQVNETADFEINIKNVGRVELQDVRVMDKVPAGVQFIDSDPKPSNLGRNGDLQWDMGTLKPGEERNIRLQLKPTQPGEIGSTAQVYSAARASMRTLVTKPQLKISHTADPKTLVGNNVVFDVIVENTGNGPAKDVIIQEEVPDLLEYQDGSRELEYEIGTLLPGQSRRVQLGLRAAKVGRLRNVMFASARGGLQAKHETNVEIIAPKLETSSSGPTLRYIQRQVSHTFTVANKGTAKATNMQLIARLPSGLRFINADNRGRYDSNTHSVVWQMTEMNPGVTGNVELVTLPTGAGQQDIRFEAVADRNLKSSTVQSLNIEHLVDVFIDIDDVVDPIEIGGNTSYRIRMINQGTQAAGNVQIQVDFPSGLEPTAVDGSLRNQIRGQQVIFEPISSLRPGDEIGVTIRAVGKVRGDHRISVNMKTDGRETPVTKEETTKVYADR